MSIQTPILFCIFNRPDLTARVFESIRNQQPAQLLVIGDGPRETDGEAELVRQCREIVSNIDWACDVKYDFSDTNLGCKRRMATGITWAFEHVERLIILEDDCLPHADFYGYCEELLQRFESHPEVMMISGDSFQPEPRSESSYYFSRWAHIWGWATWKRAWDHYDVEMNDWDIADADQLLSFDSELEKVHWSAAFESAATGAVDTWDFAWQYAIWRQQGLVILPERNMIANIGFDSRATHTADPSSVLADLPVFGLGEMQHPCEIRCNVLADRWTLENIFASGDSQDLLLRPRVPWWKKVFKFNESVT